MNGAEKSRNSVLKGTISLTIATITVKIIGLIYKIPLTRFLGEEGMGYFNSAYTVYAFFYILCTAGVPKAVTILISEARGAGRVGDDRKTARVALGMFTFVGILVTLTFFLLSSPLSILIGNSRACYTMLAIAPSILFISVSAVIRGYLSADMEFSVIAVSQIIEGVGKLGVGLAFAMIATKAGLPLPIISALTILGVSVGAIFGLVYLLVSGKRNSSRGSSNIRISRKERREIAKRILSISLPITFSAAVMSITGIIDLLQIMRGLASLGYSEDVASALYGNYTTLAVPMFNLAIAVITPVSVAYMPILARARAKEDEELLERSIRSALEFSAFLSAPLLVGLFCYSSEALHLLFGNTGNELGSKLLLLLLPSVFFTSNLLITNSLLEACGVVKAPVLSMLVGGALKVFVSFFLIRNPEYTIAGAPIGTVVSYASALAVSLAIAAKKVRCRIPILESSLLPYASAVVAILPTKILHGFLKNALSSDIAFLFILPIAMLSYLILTVITGVFGKKKLNEMSKYTN